MLQISGLTKSYGLQTLFKDVSFTINPGERVGLVGRNGHGKTTLFRIIGHMEEPDSGTISTSYGYRIGHLSQHLHFTEKTALEEAALGLPQQEGGWREVYKVEAILEGLGFSKEMLEQSPNELSGGYQVRLDLAKLIASEPNMLLLDEPTNYLDIVSMRWLTTFLKSWKGELMIITHDHGFIDSVTTHTLGIHRQGVRKIEGSTTKYYQQLALEEEIHEQSRLNQEKKIKHTEKFIDTFRAKASKAKAVQSRVKQLEKMKTLEKLADIQDLSLRFSYKSFPGKRLLDVEGLSFAYPGQSEPLISNLSFTLGPRDRIGVIGKNGKGKSTFLRILADELKPTAGKISRSSNLDVAYFGQTNVERLHPNLTVEEEIQTATEIENKTLVRTIAGHMMFSGDAAEKTISVLSGGEKSRVMLGKMLLTPANLLLLDEPTNHLDMQSTDALQVALEKFPGAVIMVIHSETIWRATATRLIVFDRGKTMLFEGTYDDFLRRVGWDGEESPKTKPIKKPEQVATTAPHARSAKADIKKRHQKVLTPLQDKVTQLERKIQKQEKELSQETERLIEMTKDGFGEDAATLARKIHKLKQDIEALYEELSKSTEHLEDADRKYREELTTLGE